MAHWAELDENNIVIRVTVGDNDDPNGDEGYQWLLDNLGGRWVKTSYNTMGGVHSTGGIPFRMNFAGINFFYDEEKDAFIPPKPAPLTKEDGTVIAEWVLNEETCLWEIKDIE